MLTDLLMERPWMSPTALGLLVVLGPFVVAWLTRRDKLAWLYAQALSSRSRC